MRAMTMVAAAACLAGCGGTSERDRLLNRIEWAVPLPAGAPPLSAYARTYAPGPDDKLHGFWFVPRPAPPREACETLLAGFSSRPSPCPPASFLETAQPGRRYWLPYDQLGGASDGGCDFFTLVYDPRRRAFDRAGCNDEY